MHTYIEVPTRQTPTRQPSPSTARTCSPSHAVSCLLQRKLLLGPRVAGGRGPAADSARCPAGPELTSRVLARIGRWARSGSPKVTPSDLHPLRTFAPLPDRHAHTVTISTKPKSSSLQLKLSSPRRARTKPDAYLTGSSGVLAEGCQPDHPGPEAVINRPISSAAPVQHGMSARALQRCQTCKQVRCIELQGEGSYYGTPGPRHSHPYYAGEHKTARQ